MADIVVTAANVKRVSGTKQEGVAGAAITAGQAVYKDAADGKYKLADVTTSAVTAAAAGFALDDGAIDQPIIVQINGVIQPGATLVKGETYVLSASGKFSPIADLVASDYVTILGVAKDATDLLMAIFRSGVQK